MLGVSGSDDAAIVKNISIRAYDNFLHFSTSMPSISYGISLLQRCEGAKSKTVAGLDANRAFVVVTYETGPAEC